MAFFYQGTFYDWAGYFGVAFYLISYLLLQVGLIRGSGYSYAVMNLIAASLVLVSLSTNFNLSAAMIQIMWIAISTFGIIRLYVLHRTLRFNGEELELMRVGMPDMPKPFARRLFNSGVWSDANAGTELTVEGEPVAYLHYLFKGEADVLTQGQRVAAIKRGFVGEMNVMEPGPASATVVTNLPSRIFSVPGEALRRQAANDSEFRAYLQQHLSQATRSKLVEANKRLAGTG